MTVSSDRCLCMRHVSGFPLRGGGRRQGEEGSMAPFEQRREQAPALTRHVALCLLTRTPTEPCYHSNPTMVVSSSSPSALYKDIEAAEQQASDLEKTVQMVEANRARFRHIDNVSRP